MAIEDGAVLGNLLSRLTSPAQLPTLLQAYEDLRLPRTAETQNQSRLNQKIFHLPDGEAQQKRDASMREAMGRERRRWGLPSDSDSDSKPKGSYELSCLSMKLSPIPPNPNSSGDGKDEEENAGKNRYALEARMTA